MATLGASRIGAVAPRNAVPELASWFNAAPSDFGNSARLRASKRRALREAREVLRAAVLRAEQLGLRGVELRAHIDKLVKPGDRR